MANPEVSRLIEELSNILNQNREKRNTMDAMLTGLAQGQAQAQARTAQAAAENGQAAGRGASEAAKAAGAPSGAESSYGGDGDVSPYSRTGGMPRVSSRALSPSTTREGRLKLGGDYARTQQLLSENPYRMQENAPEYRPNTDPALEEQKRRFTQNLMLSRGETGGPLGGAGQPAPRGDGLDPNVVNAVSRSGGPVAPMRQTMQGQTMQANPLSAQGGPPQGWSPDDYALLESLSQRYPGG
jgi:hypothetical protein